MRREHKIASIAAALLLGYGLLRGGTDSNDWLSVGAVLALVCLLALRPPATGALAWLLALPACIAIQLLPWPAHSAAPMLTLSHLVRVLIYLALFLTVRHIAAAGPHWVVLLAAVPLVFGCVEAVAGIIRHVRYGEDNYAIGSFSDHSHFGGLIAMLLPLAILFAVYYRQLALYAAPMVLFAALLHSFSRMALAACGIAIVAIVLIRTRRLKMSLATAAALLVATVVLAPAGLADRFERISTYDGFRHDAALVRWQDTLRLIAAHPILGSGAGAYQAAFVAYNSATDDKPVVHANNDYLQWIAEMGVAGTLVIFALLALALRRCVAAGRVHLIALGCAGGLIALLAHSIFEFQMYIPANVLTFAWLAGLGCGIYDMEIV